MTGPALRLATAADLPAIRELIPRSVRGLGGACYSPAQIESAIRNVFGPDTRLIDDGTYFVVTDATGLVGCGGWSRRRTLYGGDQMKSAEDPALDPTTDPARIRAFFVAPERARQGIGSMVLRASLRAATAARFRDAELVATLPGESLYAAHGFVAVERIDAPLPDGLTIPFVRMRRAL